MHILLTGKMGYNSFHTPFVLGHECAGIVAKGKLVRDLDESRADLMQWGRMSRVSRWAIG